MRNDIGFTTLHNKIHNISNVQRGFTFHSHPTLGYYFGLEKQYVIFPNRQIQTNYFDKKRILKTEISKEELNSHIFSDTVLPLKTNHIRFKQFIPDAFLESNYKRKHTIISETGFQWKAGEVFPIHFYLTSRWNHFNHLSSPVQMQHGYTLWKVLYNKKVIGMAIGNETGIMKEQSHITIKRDDLKVIAFGCWKGRIQDTEYHIEDVSKNLKITSNLYIREIPIIIIGEFRISSKFFFPNISNQDHFFFSLNKCGFEWISPEAASFDDQCKKELEIENPSDLVIIKNYDIEDEFFCCNDIDYNQYGDFKLEKIYFHNNLENGIKIHCKDKIKKFYFTYSMATETIMSLGFEK